MTPPAASPPALHFLVTLFAYACGYLACTFTCTTDTAVKLTAHVSAERPAIRRIPYVKRGADFVLSSVTCFVETQTIVQTQAGDSLTHTFVIPFPIVNHTYYWYLTGTQGGVPCQSISQIFWYSCDVPPPPTPRCRATIPPAYGHDSTGCTEMSSGFQPGASFIATSVDIGLYRQTAYAQNHLLSLAIWSAAANAQPLALIYGYYAAYVPDFPLGITYTQNVTLPDIPLNAGTRYCIVYRFTDIVTGPTTPRIGRRLTLGTNTCPITPAPAKTVWYRDWVPWTGTPCRAPVTAWSPYYYNRVFNYLFYGRDP